MDELLIHLRNYCNSFLEEYLPEGESEGVRTDDVREVVRGFERVLIKARCASSPSVFKRAAALCIAFVEQSPIRISVPAFQEEPCLRDNQNAICILMYTINAMHEATCERADAEDIILKNKINPSRHQFKDMVMAVSKGDGDNFLFLSLLFEALAFKENPDAQYKSRLFDN